MERTLTLGPPNPEICPPNQRVFDGELLELIYLSNKIMHQLHFCQKPYRTKRFVLRLRELLRHIQLPKEAIVGASARSLRDECDEKWQKGAQHRKNEVELIIRLHRSLKADQSEKTQKWVLQGYRKRDVLKRLTLVKETYRAKATQAEVDVLNNLLSNIKKTLEY